MSGLACLFSVMARTITCPYCLSEDVTEVDHEHEICFCNNCQPISSVRSVDNPLAWIGSDRLLLDDVTVHGLHRQVIASKDEPDVVVYLETIQQKCPDAKVSHWVIEKDEFCFLWMVWKEPTHG